MNLQDEKATRIPNGTDSPPPTVMGRKRKVAFERVELSRFDTVPKTLRITEINAFDLETVAAELNITIGRLLNELLHGALPWFRMQKPPKGAMRDLPILAEYLQKRERGTLRATDPEAIFKKVKLLSGNVEQDKS